MIELPSDLAEVLKTVQSNEHGADIAFPNANEDLLAELAGAWEKWNSVADSYIQAIVVHAKRAMANMSGEAADHFEQYLEKYAGRDDSHAATTLVAGHVMAQSLRGATQAVTQTKTEMVRELQYAKDYVDSHPAGKHDDVAQSEGIKTAAETYHTYVGQVGSGVDTMLRQSAGHIETMTSAAKSASLTGAAGGGTGTATAPGAPLTPLSGRLPGTGLDSLAPSPATLDPIAGGADGGAAGGGDGAKANAPGMPKMPEMSGMPNSSGHSASGAGQVPGLQPYKPLTPSAPNFGGGGGGGSRDNAGLPVFNPTPGCGTPNLSLAGLPGFDPGAGMSGPGALTPFTGGGSGGGSLGFGGAGGPGSSGLTGLGGAIGGVLGGGGLGGTLGGGVGGGRFGSPGGGLGGGLGGGRAGGLGGGLGGGRAGGAGGLGGGRAGGLGGGLGGGRAGGLGGGLGGGRAGGLGGGLGAGAPGSGSLAGGAARGSSAARAAGSGLSSGTAGRSTVAGQTAAGRTQTGAAAGHMPGAGGMGAGRGGKEGKGGSRFVRPTRFGFEDEEEEAMLTDSGVVGQATELEPRDKQWRRMRQRWMDEARTERASGAATAQAEEQSASSENALLTQLAGALLGPEAAAGLEAASGEATETAADAAPGTATATSTGTTATTESTGGSAEDDAYLDRARSVASRRGRPDAEEGGPARTESRGESAPTAEPATPAAAAPIREEGGYQVPSPFLRAALARLATGAGA